jgi:hypothetical protein
MLMSRFWQPSDVPYSAKMSGIFGSSLATSALTSASSCQLNGKKIDISKLHMSDFVLLMCENITSSARLPHFGGRDVAQDTALETTDVC